MKLSGTSLVLVASALYTANAFSLSHQHTTMSTRTTTTALAAAKGFGAPKEQKKGKSEGQVKREQERSKYDEIAASGGQEYVIYVRQFGSDDKSWLPCGSIAVPRNAQVSDAVFANESGLKAGIVRTYPKLRGYENEFEFGFNLKVYPGKCVENRHVMEPKISNIHRPVFSPLLNLPYSDDPIEVANKTGKKSGLSVGNWISNLLSPVDASNATPPKN